MNTENQKNYSPSPMFWLIITVFTSLSVGVMGSAITVKYLTPEPSRQEDVLSATVGTGSLVTQIFSNIDKNLRRATIDIDNEENETRGQGVLPDGTLDEGFMNIYDSRF